MYFLDRSQQESSQDDDNVEEEEKGDQEVIIKAAVPKTMPKQMKKKPINASTTDVKDNNKGSNKKKKPLTVTKPNVKTDDEMNNKKKMKPKTLNVKKKTDTTTVHPSAKFAPKGRHPSSFQNGPRDDRQQHHHPHPAKPGKK
jgi:hypothetical protein